MTQHSDRAHATLAPSSAYRFMACPGSIRMASGIVDVGSVFAAEGTAAHQLAEQCIRGAFPAERFLGEVIAVGENRFPVTHEMADAVQVYLDVVEPLRDEADEWGFEERMDMTGLVPGVFGTADFWAYFAKPQKLVVADYKHGKGVAVEVEENEQELTYAMGVAQRMHNRGVREVELMIVQPRAPHKDGPVRRWSTDLLTLYEHVLALQNAAVAVEDPAAPLVVGDHCRFCKAAGFCGALEDKVKEIMGLEQPEARPLRDWAIEQQELNLVAQWLKGREAFAHTEAMAGRMPPGAKLVAKRPTRKWIDQEAAGKALLEAGVDMDDLYEPPSLKSPAVVEKLLPKPKREIIGTLAKKESSGTVLAPMNDPRSPVDPHNASGFEAVEIEER